MSILKELTELLEAGVITEDTAKKIQSYYSQKGGDSQNRLLIVFGILGAILIGLGIILILAHNWDNLSRGIKTFFAFLPLLIGQGACLFTLLKKQDSVAWREGSAAFLFFAVAASISLVSQIYNIPGNVSSFILTWMLLCLPLVYVMQSSIVSLAYICGITYYACEMNYWTWNGPGSHLYWLLLLLVLPHYYWLYKTKPQSNFLFFHHWLIPLSLVICLGTLADEFEYLLVISYMSLFGVFYLIGHSDFFQNQKIRNNAYLILGALGTFVMLLGLSFGEFWEELRRTELPLKDIVGTTDFLALAVPTIFAGILFYQQNKAKAWQDIKPVAPVFLLFIILFLIGHTQPAVVVLVNLLVFVIGVLTIREGASKNHLGILNYGLLIITALVLCRFFDTNISFVVRGLLFVAVGVGFFLANSWMVRKRKEG